MRKPPPSSAPECRPLLDAATKQLFHNNAFRITGLPVDAAPREVSKRADKLKQMVELGVAIGTHAFALKPEPTLDQVRDAVHKLKDPQARLVEELFWFWPDEFGQSATDAALRALASGNHETAFQIWTSKESDSPNGIAATHNLAVYWHLTALEFETYTAAAQLDEERKDKLQTYWRNAFRRWDRLAADESLWGTIRQRARQLDDTRLTDGFIRQMRLSFPEALDKINAEFALSYAEGGRTDLAKLHLQFMRETNRGLDNVEKTIETVLAPEIHRLREHIQRAQDRAKSRPNEGAEAARELLKQATRSLALLDLLSGENSDLCSDLSDEVAAACNQLQVAYHNATEDAASCLDILKAILPLARSAPIRTQIKTNLGTVTLMALPSQLLKLRQTALGPRWKWEQFQGLIPSLDLALADQPASADLQKLFDLAAEILRDISLDALSPFPDSEVAPAAHDLAVHFARRADLAEKLLKDEPRFAGARAAQPIHAFLKTVRESTETPAAKLARIQAWLPELERVASEVPTAAEIRDAAAFALQEISRKAFEDPADAATAVAANELALKCARSADLKKRLRADKVTFSKTPPEPVEVLSKRLQEGTDPPRQKLEAVERWLELDFPRLAEPLPAQSQDRSNLGDAVAEVIRDIFKDAVAIQDQDTAIKANHVALTVVRGLRLKNLLLEDHKKLFSTNVGPYADRPQNAAAPSPNRTSSGVADKKTERKEKRPIVNERELIRRMLESLQRSGDPPAAKLERFEKDVIPVIAAATGASGYSVNYGYLAAPGSEDLVNLLNYAARILREISVAAWNNHKDKKTALAAIQLAMTHASDPQLREKLEDDYIAVGRLGMPPPPPSPPPPPPQPPPRRRPPETPPPVEILSPKARGRASGPRRSTQTSPSPKPASATPRGHHPPSSARPGQAEGFSPGFWLVISALVLISILCGILKSCTAQGASSKPLSDQQGRSSLSNPSSTHGTYVQPVLDAQAALREETNLQRSAQRTTEDVLNEPTGLRNSRTRQVKLWRGGLNT